MTKLTEEIRTNLDFYIEYGLYKCKKLEKNCKNSAIKTIYVRGNCFTINLNI